MRFLRTGNGHTPKDGDFRTEAFGCLFHQTPFLPTTQMLVLFETAAGYALFKVCSTCFELLYQLTLKKQGFALLDAHCYSKVADSAGSLLAVSCQQFCAPADALAFPQVLKEKKIVNADELATLFETPESAATMYAPRRDCDEWPPCVPCHFAFALCFQCEAESVSEVHRYN